MNEKKSKKRQYILLIIVAVVLLFYYLNLKKKKEVKKAPVSPDLPFYVQYCFVDNEPVSSDGVLSRLGAKQKFKKIEDYGLLKSLEEYNKELVRLTSFEYGQVDFKVMKGIFFNKDTRTTLTYVGSRYAKFGKSPFYFGFHPVSGIFFSIGQISSVTDVENGIDEAFVGSLGGVAFSDCGISFDEKTSEVRIGDFKNGLLNSIAILDFKDKQKNKLLYDFLMDFYNKLP